MALATNIKFYLGLPPLLRERRLQHIRTSMAESRVSLLGIVRERLDGQFESVRLHSYRALKWTIHLRNRK